MLHLTTWIVRYVIGTYYVYVSCNDKSANGEAISSYDKHKWGDTVCLFSHSNEIITAWKRAKK